MGFRQVMLPGLVMEIPVGAPVFSSTIVLAEVVQPFTGSVAVNVYVPPLVTEAMSVLAV